MISNEGLQRTGALLHWLDSQNIAPADGVDMLAVTIASVIADGARNHRDLAIGLAAVVARLTEVAVEMYEARRDDIRH